VPRGAWLWFNLLVASMAVVVAARNGVLFLVAWEVMTLASYFLVTLHHDRSGSRRAGRVYLVATHIGTAFLLVFFLALPGPAGSLDFDSAAPGASPLLPASALFLLAVVGFGTKAGFMPLHVWLPEAHPAAPSHVSAVMSGVMIKMGIYGLVRMLPYLGPPPAWWGWLLIAVGLVSGILGVLYALAQHELKRLLAYHSIENIGIITCGLGLGLLGEAAGEPWLAALGFGGALLHVVNHAVFKGLLFLGAGSVLQGAGTGEIEHLGGLLRRMPWTAAAFLVGAIAISGLPPLNGFVSEFLIYLGSFRAAAGSAGPVALAGIVLIAGLALIGGLAAACFVKAFGISFLGEPRSAASRDAREAGLLMRIPMVLLAAACLAIGLGAPWVLRALAPVVPAASAAFVIPAAAGILVPLAGVAGAFVALALLLAALRAGILARRGSARTVTWDCGYAAPGARMQYTASSFAQPILEMVAPILGTRVSSLKPSGLFPERASHATATPDTFRERVVAPITAEIGRRVAPFRRIQEGRVQVYVLYIALTLLAVLLYQFLVNP
jgi:hydrogenase-4 component B